MNSLLRRFTLTLLVAFVGIAPPLQAQNSPSTIWQPPRLIIPVRTDLPVQLQTVRIRSEVNGRLALTELELTFFNPNARVLEGELQFPLLDGQSVASFAMDVNGNLREAVPVEKAKAQAAFEEVIRGRIDPGLLEVTQGNNFKLRVYPIPANGTKRVVLRINETLSERNGHTLYRLPIEYAEQVGTFSVDMTILGAASAPSTRRNAPLALRFEASEKHSDKRFHAAAVQNNFSGHGVLDIEIATDSEPLVTTQTMDGKTYFYTDFSLQSTEMERAIPSRISLIWDSSGSGAHRNHGREFSLLDAYFKRMGDGEVRLTYLRNIVEPVQRFTISNGNWRELRKALENTAYDGATNLGAFVPDNSVSEVLLFSDGISNFGEQAFPSLTVPLYAISAAIKADTVTLQHLVNSSKGARGRFIDLSAETAAEAVHKLLFATTQVTFIDADGAQQIVTSSPYATQGRYQVAGVLVDTMATLQIHVAHPNGKRDVWVMPIKSDSTQGTFAAALWARMQIAELEGAYEVHRGEIRRLGRAFGLVTRETSLIVLDRVEDYVRYEINPPAELRADYQRILATNVQQRNAVRQSHLDHIAHMFAQKLAWWNREFPKDRRVTSVKQVRAQDTRASMALSAMAPAPNSSPVVTTGSSIRRLKKSNDAEVSELEAAAKKEKTSLDFYSAPATTTNIKLQKWQPDSPYATRLRNAEVMDMYRIYLDEKPSYLNSTAFFLDVADLFFEKGQNNLGIRILSNLAEMDLESRHILRILGYRLVQAGHAKLAIPVFKKVLALSPEEPQSYRDLGLAYTANKQNQQAVDTLYQVVIRPWNGRFPEIELITLADLNSIVATSREKVDTSRIDARLLKNMPLDLRAVLTWDADNTDIDLWVTDPDGEKAYFGNRLTYQGARMSLDFTGGYGPEEFSLKQAKPGKYKIEAQYFGDRRQNITGPTTLQVKLTTKFGTSKQQEQAVTLRLNGRQELVFVGEFDVNN